MTSKPLKWLLWTVLTAALLLAALLAAVPFVLPAYVEQKLIPELALDFNLTPAQVHVRRIGWWGTEIGPIRLTRNNAPAITIDNLKIDYSPLSLLRGQARGMALEGLVIEIAITKKGIAVAGRQLPSKRPPEGGRGTINLKTLLPINLSYFSILHSRLEVNWKEHRYAIPIDLRLQTKQLKNGKLKGHAKLAIAGNPLVIGASLDQTANNGRIDFDLTHFLLESLTAVSLLPETLQPTGTMDLTGRLYLDLAPFNLTGLELSGQFKETKIATPDGVFACKRHHMVSNGQLKNGVLTSESKLTAEALEITLPEGRLRIPRVNVDGTLTRHPANADVASTMSADVTLSDVDSQLGSAAVNLPKIILQASGVKAPGQRWQFKTRTRISNGRISDSTSGFKMTDLSMDLPFDYPDPSATRAGRVNITAIQWHKRPVGGVTGTLQQTPTGLNIKLRHLSKLIPGLPVLINGAIKKSGARIDAEIPRHHQLDEWDLGSMATPVAGIKLTGRISASAALIMDPTGMSGSGNISFNQGKVSQPSQRLLLDGVNMEIRFDDLLKLQTAPQQRLYVDRLSFGDMEAEHLDINFQVEGRQTLLINQAGMGWSQGAIRTSAILIAPGVKDYQATLICQRLHLASVLEQLGVAQAEGEGSVSGRIPIRWAKGDLSFNKGYLLSTPGQTGIIRLSGTQKVLMGLPPGTPQHTQLDIATEALKDYTYTSAKLEVQSQADHLLLKLQLDGKPNRLLPFAYDRDLGQFKRVAGEGQADFKGISIDFNFRSPLNEILNYKDLIRRQ